MRHNRRVRLFRHGVLTCECVITMLAGLHIGYSPTFDRPHVIVSGIMHNTECYRYIVSLTVSLCTLMELKCV